MKKNKAWIIGVGLLMCLAGAGLTACSGNDPEDSGSLVMGRLTGVSDSNIELEVFDKGGKRNPENASGSAVDWDRVPKPEGTPPGDMQQGERSGSTPPGDMQQKEQSEGTTPSDVPEAGQDGQQENQKDDKKDDEEKAGAGKEMKTREKKVFAIDSGTKFYKQDGEEKTEITVGELELGTMLSVAVDGDTAVTVTVQSIGNRRAAKY